MLPSVWLMWKMLITPPGRQHPYLTHRTSTLLSPDFLLKKSQRNILGTKNLHEILSNRESIALAMQTILDEATTAWGIKVERVEM